MTVITVVEHQRLTEIREIKTQYELRPERGYVWIQRICVWLLGKIGAFANVPTTTIARHDVGKHGDTFVTLILRSKNAILGSFDRNPTECLIGPEEYATLMGELIHYGQFELESRYFRQIEGETRVYGLKVRVIPWMRGILLL